MSNVQLAYLAFVIAAFLVFVGTLFVTMLVTNARRGPQAQDRDAPPQAQTHH